ncbi:hypothetical protein OQA88_5380 [Cercophora sp. LCS_1]
MAISALLATLIATLAIANGRVIKDRAAPGECTFSISPNDGDTCGSFAEFWGITLADLRAFNPTLSCPAANTPLSTSKELCIEMVLPQPVSSTSSKTSTTSKTTSVTALPTTSKPSTTPTTSKTATSPTTTNTSIPSPTQPNVIKTCTQWYKVVSGDTCQRVVDKYGTFSLSQFYTWNPDVGSTCAGLELNVYVCIGVPGTPTTTSKTTTAPKPTSTNPSPTQPNVIKTCARWYKVASGDTCQKVVDRFGTFSLSQFYTWNPDVGSTCAGLELNVYVCVGVPGTPTTTSKTTTTAPKPTSTNPSPTQPNVIKTCARWYKVASGDTCQKVVDRFGTFTLSQFYTWNPDVGSTCAGLELNVYVCVGIPGTPTAKPTTTAKATTTKLAGTVTGTAKPTPVQTGVSGSCNKWYLVSSGDGCQVVADKFKITLANL